jgi:hypothetical protein
MSPEQAGGMMVDHRSDIYSLGAIMYELFTGQPMFRGRSFGEYVRKHLTEMPVPPRQTQGGGHIDERLEALILKCLAKDPNERFNHILELRDGLLHMLGGVETNPPGYAALAHQSAVRPPSTQLPPHMLPLPAPAMVTTVPTPPHISVMASAPNPALSYGQYTLPPPPEPASTPLWVWIIGGALAIGGGVAGALWFANRDTGGNDEVVVEAPKQEIMTTTAPIPPPAAPPQLVELRFDSLPSAGVYADGHSAQLCHTPCNYTFDLKDGDKRTLVVRADGYRDTSIDVDLRAATHEFSVTLERIEPTVPDRPAETPPLEPETPDTPVAKRHPSHASRHAAKDKQVTAASEDKPAETPPPLKPDDRLEKPEGGPEPTKKPDTGKIDPADTHNPFRK